MQARQASGELDSEPVVAVVEQELVIALAVQRLRADAKQRAGMAVRLFPRGGTVPGGAVAAVQIALGGRAGRQGTSLKLYRGGIAEGRWEKSRI